MPELPEVENIARGLQAEIIGRTIDRLVVSRPGVIRGPVRWRQAGRRLVGAQIVEVARRAKRLILVTSADLGLVVQLGMTGRFLIHDDHPPRSPHTHLYVHFTDGSHLRYVDVRRFGRVWFLPGLQVDNAEEVMTAAGMGPLGPEADRIGPRAFREVIGSSHRPIKNLLLDQARLAGLGNIYADEALFAARIHPETPAGEISARHVEALRQAIRQVLRQAIRHGGTTFSDFRNAYGEMGRFGVRLKVYQRRGEPCPRCGAPIERIGLGGRSAHFCPRCQRRG